MSLARSLYPWVIRLLTKRMIGASSATSIRSWGSKLVARSPPVLGADLLDHLPGLARLALEGAVDGGEDLLRRRHHHLDAFAGQHRQVVGGAAVAGIGQGDAQPAVAALQGHDPVVLGEADGDQIEQLRVDLVGERGQKFQPLLGGQGGGQILALERLAGDQDLAEAPVVLALQCQSRLDLGAGNLEVLAQYFSEQSPGHPFISLSYPWPVPPSAREQAAGRSASRE